MYMKKIIFGNPSTPNCKNGKHLASIMDDSAITCDEVIESYDNETRTIATNKAKFLYFTSISLITIALFIDVSTYCYLIKY